MTARWMTRWKPAVGFEIFGPVGNEIIEFRFEISDQTAAQLVQIDIARAHHRCRVLIFDQREQEVFERGVFVVALVGQRQSPVERLFETARERGHSVSHFLCSRRSPRNHFFSMMHCKGC